MPLRLPKGYRCVVNLGCDLDAIALWIGSYGLTLPSFMHRGEFGARVGVPRVLALLRKYNIKATWCVPGHTIETFPEEVKQVVKEGHEIAHHGYIHENITKLSREQEAKYMDMGIDAIKSVTGRKPRGYRSPSWDYSQNTLDLLLERGFEWDSSLMGNDFTPYYLRKGDGPALLDKPYHFGEPTKILEIPVSWYLDDFPVQEYMGSHVPWIMQDPDAIYKRWTTIFDYMYENVPGGVLTLTTHPQTIGRAHMIVMLEKVIQHINSRPGVLWATLSEIRDMQED
jgi:peptidoglycan/xylan/chitin deacetylase (PgdA/CDA1 family)